MMEDGISQGCNNLKIHPMSLRDLAPAGNKLSNVDKAACLTSRKAYLVPRSEVRLYSSD